MTKSAYNEEIERERVDSVSFQIVKQIAAEEKTNLEDIPSYAQEIDFESLDTLIAKSSSKLTICFRIEEYDIEVTSNKTVKLD